MVRERVDGVEFREFWRRHRGLNRYARRPIAGRKDRTIDMGTLWGIDLGRVSLARFIGMRGDGGHTSPAAGHLEHHLRRVARDRGGAPGQRHLPAVQANHGGHRVVLPPLHCARGYCDAS
jgi:hypothetical protein